MYQHGPFAWGKYAHDAVHNAVVMEEVAKMAWIARSINPQLNHIDSFLMNKHFMRKHGPNAYYCLLYTSRMVRYWRCWLWRTLQCATGT